MQLLWISDPIGSIFSGEFSNCGRMSSVWKLTAMDLDYVWTADYKGGWAHAAGSFKAPADPMSSKFPPDRPLRGVVTAPFPKIVDVPFHYLNPVSGCKPPLYLP